MYVLGSAFYGIRNCTIAVAGDKDDAYLCALARQCVHNYELRRAF